MRQPRILIIYTGGTIGMIEDIETHALRPFDFTHLIDNVPKVKMLEYVIDNIQFNPPIDSSDMSIEHWKQMTRHIADNYDKYDGFVVLHGTDTMAYTASALSFMLEGLTKPVIITGSQLPIGEVRTDGEENLITALQIAAARDSDGLPMIREVAILFENYLWRGNRSTKRSADNFNAFKSNNYPALAKIGLGIDFDRKVLARPDHTTPLKANYNLDQSVLVVDLFPGLSETTLRHSLETPGIKGVVMRTYGAGNGPTASWFINAIADAVKRGIIILNVTQCVNGSVHATRYVSGDILSTTGVLSGHDITFEAAITKMMFLFGQKLSHDEVLLGLTTPICGEMTVK
ncbi:MAG: type I asparaginase [Muribaculaceae bacterium]|nr:type I asparaginase [Muribaculaceae bacterium]